MRAEEGKDTYLLRGALFRVAALVTRRPGSLTSDRCWLEVQLPGVLARSLRRLRFNGDGSTSPLPRTTGSVSRSRRGSSPRWDRLHVVHHGWVPRAGAEETELLYCRRRQFIPGGGYIPRLGALEHKLQTHTALARLPLTHTKKH